jgi:ankyrin repeat protein
MKKVFPLLSFFLLFLSCGVSAYAPLSFDIKIVTSKGNVEKFNNSLQTYPLFVNIKNRENSIALHYVPLSASERTVELLVLPLTITGKTSSFSSKTYKMANFFISDCCNMNSNNANDQTSLRIAVQSNDTKTIEYLISRGVDVNAKDSHGMTPLHTAVEYRKKEAVDVLLTNGSDTNAINEHSKTPLAIAVEVHEMEQYFPGQSKKDIIKALFAHGAKPGNITEAIAAGDIDTVKLLITVNRELLNINGQDNSATPLWSAAYWDSIEIAKYLVSIGANINKICNNETPLHLSSRNGSIAITELLISAGADVNLTGGWGANTPLFNVIFYGKNQIFYVSTVRNGKEMKTVREFFYMKIGNSAEDYIKVARSLIDNGADVNAKSRWSPLYAAVAKNWKEMVELLISAGADVNSHDEDLQSTPLHIAAEDGNKDIAELLISKGAEVNAKDKDGKTPLKLALENGWNSVVDLLRKHGAKE